MTDEQKKRIDEDDRRRFELVMAIVARGTPHHNALWQANQIVEVLSTARRGDEDEAMRLAQLPEREWPVEALVAEIDRLRAQLKRLGESYDYMSQRLADFEAKAKAAKPAEEASA